MQVEKHLKKELDSERRAGEAALQHAQSVVTSLEERLRSSTASPDLNGDGPSAAAEPPALAGPGVPQSLSTLDCFQLISAES